MIKSFKNKHTELLWNGGFVKKWEQIAPQAERKLRLLDSAEDLKELSCIPSCNLEKLKGDRKEFYSIRINRQFRICFLWDGEHAQDVEIVDYH